MNGAESLINALAKHGVDACFANPGTSEMQLVAALDKQTGIRAVLCLFEGVVTGAADGYGRMADKPALNLLHLGPGFANGMANLHNAQRAGSPVLNMVGDHATDHLQHDAPLTSDIKGMATPVSRSFRVSDSATGLAQTGLDALADSLKHNGSISTFVVPADHAWTDIEESLSELPDTPLNIVSDAVISEVAAQLQSASNSCLFLGGRTLREDALYQAGRIAAATGCRLVTETFFARQARGVGRVPTERLAYFGEAATEQLAGIDLLVLAGTKAPVSFFAYPDKPSVLAPEVATQCTLVDPGSDALVGTSLIKSSWQQIFNPISKRFFDIKEINQILTGSFCVRLVQENIYLEEKNFAAPPVYATNIYQKIDSSWFMISHHASMSSIILDPDFFSSRRDTNTTSQSDDLH